MMILSAQPSIIYQSPPPPPPPAAPTSRYKSKTFDIVAKGYFRF